MPTFLLHHFSISLALISALAAVVFYWIQRYSYFHLPDIHYHIVAASVATAFLGGGVLGYVISRFHRMAIVDPLTKLWNKRYFNIRLAEELNRRQRTGSSLCIALIDIDDFKSINDQYGHAAGDEALINIANIFKRDTRNIDIVTRWGGDEFAILFPDTKLERGISIANRLKEDVLKCNRCHRATISVGVVMVDDQWDKNRVLVEVDKMLFKAKQVKNRVVAENEK